LVSAIALACCASSGEGAFSCRFLLKHSPMHGFKGGKASQGAGGAPKRLGAQGGLQGDAFERAAQA
jgi:hypothetical protein